MAERWIELRYRGRCCICHGGLGIGETARFDTASREISCPDCDEGARTGRNTTAREAAGAIRPHVTHAERERVRNLIAEARGALAASRHAS